ncbi:183_t:CDS:1, partial [Entrophospora sp. SA101]
AFLRHEVNRYQKKIKFQWRNWLLLKDLSNNYNMDKETNTISNCICNHEEEINRKVKKEVEILYRQILNHNQETFEKFMKKLDKEYEEQINTNKNLRCEIEEKKFQLQEMEDKLFQA